MSSYDSPDSLNPNQHAILDSFSDSFAPQDPIDAEYAERSVDEIKQRYANFGLELENIKDHYKAVSATIISLTMFQELRKAGFPEDIVIQTIYGAVAAARPKK